jgi:hypothetical protein
MTEQVIPVAVFAMLAVGAVAVFGWLSVASWADARRREREAYYRSEILKRIAETQGSGANAALELYREQERAAADKRHEAYKLSGVITIGVGIGLMAFLRGVGDQAPAYLVGLIPLLAGVALLLYAYVLAPKR